MVPLAVFVLLLFLFSLASRRLEQTIVTAPIVFTAAGMLMFPALQGILQAGFTAKAALHLAEVGLVMLLFTDASRTDLKVLRSIRNLPARLLSTGMLLTILLGAVVARLVFPQLSIWEAGILSAILAPTDAGLGQIIVNSPRVPMRIRQALNVEAGLNDGLSVPFLLFFIALAAAKIEGGAGSLLQFIVEQLGFGALVGLAIGLGRRVVAEPRPPQAMDRGIVPADRRGRVAVALPGGVRNGRRKHVHRSVCRRPGGANRIQGCRQAQCRVRREWGQLLNLGVFFLFGMAAVRDWPQFGMASWFYALLSLTLVRMLPVAIALVGTRLSPASVVFMGWFGPRGLASIVLGLVYLEQEVHLPGESTIRFAVMATVLLSIFAHGLTRNAGH